MEKIDVFKVLEIHVVHDKEYTGWMNVHTHGLCNFFHPELQILCTPLFYPEACKLLFETADYLLNDSNNPKIEIDDIIYTKMGQQAKIVQGYEENQLRLEGIAPKCEECHADFD